jgi:hypothetical protein
MRALLAAGALAGLLLLPVAVFAAPLDGTAPILCAMQSVMECSHGEPCERGTSEDTGVPAFVRIDVSRRLLSSMDGTRTSPIAASQRANGRLMLQGMQNERVWGAVINEASGHMSATIGEDDGAMVISGACIAP